MLEKTILDAADFMHNYGVGNMVVYGSILTLNIDLAKNKPLSPVDILYATNLEFAHVFTDDLYQKLMVSGSLLVYAFK